MDFGGIYIGDLPTLLTIAASILSGAIGYMVGKGDVIDHPRLYGLKKIEYSNTRERHNRTH